MKVLIWFDMEGISGIDNPRACDFGSPLLQESRKYATADVNAVIRGLKQGGATVIDIFDGHDFGGNLIADELDPHVNYLSGGWKDTLPELIRTRAFAEYNALVLVGHHSQSGTVNGFYSHTVSPDVALRLNGQPVGEIELAAWLAGYFGVRTIMVSSDEAGVNEARVLLPEIETVSVKRKSKSDFECFPSERVHAQLEETAFNALNKLDEFKPYILSGPIIVEILYKLTKLADNMALFPGYEKRNERTVVYKAEDFLEAFRAFTAFQAIMPEFIATFFRQMLRRVKRQVSVDIKALQSEVDAELESKFIPFPPINLATHKPKNE
ncbi:MAG: M55 family metallopeptidase [Candidatus Bathyarchaeota archaeon]|nr:MAG: M55 family metallopeptidase [Candidatus Bathyarchaeota archaeon]